MRTGAASGSGQMGPTVPSACRGSLCRNQVGLSIVLRPPSRRNGAGLAQSIDLLRPDRGLGGGPEGYDPPDE